jgi:hypothetical protein
MEQNTLPHEKLQELRTQGVIHEHEIAFIEGDLLVAINVITSERRLLNKSFLQESSPGKRLLKG